MSIATLIRKMAEAGAPPEAIAIAVEAIEAAVAEATEKEADRKARDRDRKRAQKDAAGNSVEIPRKILGTSVEIPAEPPLSRPPNENKSNPPTHTPPDITTRARKAGPTDADFEAWWSAYPRKVEKVAARKAFERAWNLVEQPDKLATLIEAATAYAVRTDPGFVKHPTTWLNKGCWADEEASNSRIYGNERHSEVNGVPGGDQRLDRMLAGALAAVHRSEP